MELYHFNVSGYKFVFDSYKLDEYPGNLFKLIGTTQILTIKDKDGSYFINRNPKFAEYIYGSIVHDFCVEYLLDKIVPNCSVFELEQLSNEFKYYGFPSLFVGKGIARKIAKEHYQDYKISPMNHAVVQLLIGNCAVLVNTNNIKNNYDIVIKCDRFFKLNAFPIGNILKIKKFGKPDITFSKNNYPHKDTGNQIYSLLTGDRDFEIEINL